MQLASPGVRLSPNICAARLTLFFPCLCGGGAGGLFYLCPLPEIAREGVNMFWNAMDTVSSFFTSSEFTGTSVLDNGGVNCGNRLVWPNDTFGE